MQRWWVGKEEWHKKLGKNYSFRIRLEWKISWEDGHVEVEKPTENNDDDVVEGMEHVMECVNEAEPEKQCENNYVNDIEAEGILAAFLFLWLQYGWRHNCFKYGRKHSILWCFDW